eukprot:6332378-Pyramimonas_sp.AAC.1
MCNPAAAPRRQRCRWGSGVHGEVRERALRGRPEAPRRHPHRGPAGPLVFIEPRASEPFTFRTSKVTRTGFPLSHGRVITAVACQGRTAREGDGAGEQRPPGSPRPNILGTSDPQPYLFWLCGFSPWAVG